MIEETWINIGNALEIHDVVIETTGGKTGVRDKGLLDSALSRPVFSRLYEENDDVFDLAARYTEAVVKNHPFIDGNKRTAFMIADLFLLKNQFDLPAEEQNEQYELINGLAAGEASREQLATYFRESCVALSGSIPALEHSMQHHAPVLNRLAFQPPGNP